MRNDIAARLFIAAMTEEYVDEGASEQRITTIADDALWAASIFVKRIENFDQPEQRSGQERRSNVDRRCSDCADEQLEQALKEQFLQATLNSIFRGR